MPFNFRSTYSLWAIALVMAASVLPACQSTEIGIALPPEAPRKGDEIMVAGRMFHTGTPVKLWFDEGGYNAYRTEARFRPLDQAGWDTIVEQLPAGASPNRYGWRVDRIGHRDDFSTEEIEEIRDGWSLDQLQNVVDQFVIHYDVSGTSTYCFEVLHDHRCLSVHFMLDVDGTVYQTLDLSERAWHGGKSNSRSIGIEIANIGAYPLGSETLDEWYVPTALGGVRLNIPEDRLGPLDPESVFRPARSSRIRGTIHGREVEQYDLTDAQYRALIRLTEALVRIFPEMANDYPRDADGNVRTDELTQEEWLAHSGLIGHWHLTTNKIDPGPAFNWERVRAGVDAGLGR